MSLQNEIDTLAKKIHTEALSMSIGEIISLYKEKELDIHPEFQRYFRWTPIQKTKLIESIMLGIPIPSIFVSQRDDGVWDVIDGLQRLSTIFEFVGCLRNEDGETKQPSRLQRTDYLPSFENKVWQDDTDEFNSFTQMQRLSVKRAKLDFKIIKKESDKDAKYEMFQRLNTGGTSLSDQEIRNCLMIMINRRFFEWFRNLSEFEPFTSSVQLSDRAYEEQYNLELILRYLILKNCNPEIFKSSIDIEEFLTENVRTICKNDHYDYVNEGKDFMRTFQLLNSALGNDAFRRYDRTFNRFSGSFYISSFEVVAIGLGKNINDYPVEWTTHDTENVKRKVTQLWDNEVFKRNTGSGIRASTRLQAMLTFGQEYMRNSNENKD